MFRIIGKASGGGKGEGQPHIPQTKMLSYTFEIYRQFFISCHFTSSFSLQQCSLFVKQSKQSTGKIPCETRGRKEKG